MMYPPVIKHAWLENTRFLSVIFLLNPPISSGFPASLRLMEGSGGSMTHRWKPMIHRTHDSDSPFGDNIYHYDDHLKHGGFSSSEIGT
jgi:hypothetical protein